MADYRSTGRELRKSPKGLIALLLLGSILIGGGVYAKKVIDGMQPLDSSENSGAADSSEADIEILSGHSDAVKYEFDKQFSETLSSGPLVLVNRYYSIEDTADNLLVSLSDKCNGCYQLKTADLKLQECCADALNQMTADFTAATGEKSLQITDAFRTKEQQKKIFDSYRKKAGDTEYSIPAEPGQSEHETGLCFDVNIYKDGKTTAYDGAGVYGWLTEHCAEYGFIIHYTEDTELRTEFAAEPYHFRYVGVPHAMYMVQNHLSFEEYILNIIKEYTYDGTHLEITDASGKIWETFYVLAQTDGAAVTELPRAVDRPCTISGDNRNGFIITTDTGRTVELSPQVTTTDESSETSEETTNSTT